MGVPAFFRWLSKKYPKIVLPVVEEDEPKIPDGDGNEVVVPIDISKPNPNLMEFDNLYLDMNGIVHPCTHPEGKPAPETEEDMMVEIFAYTERIVKMIRPRKLLFLAIDGVAPRAKMNQQRSRRFRSSQEAKEKEEARKEAVAMFEAMGHAVSEDTKDKKGWDSNAITPGTPFMDLLAASLRYWVVRKINTEPGWKDIQVILSDASVPGEGEHKIMDFIRRQRTNPDHDPNTRHVICGLDADLIMLSLATHEPHFRVLREDVFHQEGSRTACRICGQEGHYAAQCTGEKKALQDENNGKVAEKKPWIFLDVAILREYLEVELNVPRAPFPFDLERAIDDWVLLIFFVGNDFLPHLPSLEIREGAIDTLLKIWKDEMPRMGGYLTDHGKVELARAEIILQGIARREDDIFRRRREAEERQDQNAKRRKLEASSGAGREDSNMRIAETAYVPVETNTGPPIHPSLPPRPAFEVTAVMNSPQLNHPPSSSISTAQSFTAQDGIKLASNHDVVANRRAIRLANMNAAEMLKAELAGRASTQGSPQAADESVVVPHVPPTVSDVPVEPPQIPLPNLAPSSSIDDYAHLDVLPGLSGSQSVQASEGVGVPSAVTSPVEHTPSLDPQVVPQPREDGPPQAEISLVDVQTSENNALMEIDSPPNDVNDAITKDNGDLRGTKRKLDDTADEESFAVDDDEVPDGGDVPPAFVRKVNPDGSVEQEDTVRLWEPGYKERYYRQKFGVELSDLKFRKELTKSYVEGLAWVLHYYYQGTPSWQWYYPYHYAPFAADFEDVAKMEINFDHGQPFKPFEQLMGVFPAASRELIPENFRSLMVEEDSPIIDFYPSTFDIDMNGKKMAWQGVALLPFIDEKRLLEAMAPRYERLTEEEVRRNNWGTNLLFVGQGHGLHTFLSGLYVKRKSNDPVPLNTKLSNGIAGSVLPDPQCIPDSTYFSPFEKVSLPDMPDNHSLSSYYYYPRQLRPHRSQMLPGVRRPMRVLTSADYETLHRRGGYGRGRDNGAHGPPRGLSYNMPMHGGSGYERDRGGYGYGPPHGGPVYNNGPSSGRGSYGSNGYYGQSYNTVGYGHYYGAGRDEGHFNTVGYGHYYGLERDNEGHVMNGGYGSRGRGGR